MTEALLGELLSDTRAVVLRLLEEPLSDPADLVSRLDRHEERVRSTAETLSLADWQAGVELCARARALLGRWPALDHRGRRLAQVAVRYLVLDDDGASDLASPFGFDDDREVLDAVLRAIGEPG